MFNYVLEHKVCRKSILCVGNNKYKSSEVRNSLECLNNDKESRVAQSEQTRIV